VNKERLEVIANSTLSTFSKVVEAARIHLGQAASPAGTEAFASINTFTSTETLRTQDRINRENAEGFGLLTREPAIARVVVADEEDNRRVYYICRAAPVSVSDEEVRLASYRSPIGRLAALPIGEELVLRRDGEEIALEVLEKAQLHPQLSDQEWDSLNSVLEGEDYGVVTVESLRGLLRRDISEDLDADLLDRLLEEESVSTNVREGLRRGVITKMGLRDQPILDRYQDEIFRLPLNSRLMLLGAPGTGKTTTLIRRLGQKLDLEILEDDERRVLDATQGLDHAQSWVMFTPTELLKQYVKEAFAKERIPASDQRIRTWSDYRRELARNVFGILRSASGRGAYVMKEAAETIAPETLSDQCAWHTDFDQWQKAVFWEEIRDAADGLSANERKEVSRLGKQVLTVIDKEGTEPSSGTFIPLTKIVGEVQEQIASMKAETDRKIRGALNLQVNRDQKFLDDLAAFMDSLADVDDEIDGQDLDDEEETEQPRTKRAAAAAAYMQTLRLQARANATKRGINQSSRTGRLIEWIGEHGLGEKELLDVGENLLVQSALRRLANPVRRYVDGIPARYRRFRRLRQNENRWYREEGFAPNDIHPLEIDLLILAALRSGDDLIRRARRLRDTENAGQSTLLRQQELYRTQVLVDEATDFSPIQLGCMAAVTLPEIRSFFACGDFNQRVTPWGTRSIDELKWVIPDIDTRSISVAYRQSKQLHDLAKQIVVASGGETIDAVLPDYVDNEGVPPVLAKNLSEEAGIVDWLAERVREIERFVQQLPSIAVLVNSEEEVQLIATGLATALADQNIRVVACPNGQVMGLESDVRIFDVQHIKGLEFEAVFFVGVDRLAQNYPDVFDKYLYVGATRAATYLGLTCNLELPAGVAALEDLFDEDWR